MNGLTESEIQSVLDYYDSRVEFYSDDPAEAKIAVDLLGTIEFAAVVDTASHGIEVEGHRLAKKVSTRTVGKLVAERKIASAVG